jgi:hypothetical protein
MADINASHASLLAADEARDAAALTAVAWQMYGELAATAAPCARRLAPRGAQTDAYGGCVAGRRPPGRCQCR